jgi:transposase-like protein
MSRQHRSTSKSCSLSTVGSVGVRLWSLGRSSHVPSNFPSLAMGALSMRNQPSRSRRTRRQKAGVARLAGQLFMPRSRPLVGATELGFQGGDQVGPRLSVGFFGLGVVADGEALPALAIADDDLVHLHVARGPEGSLGPWRHGLRGAAMPRADGQPVIGQRFDREVQQGAVRIVRETGRSIAVVAQDVGVHPGTVGNWVANDRVERGEAEGVTGDGRAELGVAELDALCRGGNEPAPHTMACRLPLCPARSVLWRPAAAAMAFRWSGSAGSASGAGTGRRRASCGRGGRPVLGCPGHAGRL